MNELGQPGRQLSPSHDDMCGMFLYAGAVTVYDASLIAAFLNGSGDAVTMFAIGPDTSRKYRRVYLSFPAMERVKSDFPEYARMFRSTI